MRAKTVLILILVASGTFFNYGCTASQRRNIVNEAVENAKDYIKTEVLPKIKEEAAAAAEKKLKEKESEYLKALDEQLAHFPKKDPDTGMETVKTWKNFDSDNSGQLDASELMKAGIYITRETSARVASGEMSKDEAGQIAKGSGVTLAALAAIMLLLKGVQKLKGRKEEVTDETVGKTSATKKKPTT